MRPTPGTAILWTCLLPGAAHARLGRPGRAVVAFATCVIPFVLGYWILGQRLWWFELFRAESFRFLLDHVPIQLLPESPNLGCCIVASLFREPMTPDVARLVRLPVAHEHLGLLLTGASGILAALWASDAHWLARDERHVAARPAPAWAAGVSWLLPGAGHALLGQRGKGVVMGAAVVVVFLMGLAFAQGHAVDRPLNSAWWIGDVLFGGGTIVASFVTAPLRLTGIPVTYDLGVALGTVAGFMNLIVMIDAYNVAEDRALDDAAVREATAKEAR